MMKFFVALALFVSSVTFEEQVLVSRNSIDSNWTVSISVTNQAFAVEAYMENQLF